MERVREKSGRGRALALAMWRRQLEEHADASQHVGDANLKGETTPVVGQNPLVASEDAKVESFSKLREADQFEAGLQQRGARRRRGEAVQNDVQADGEARAGQHLRLKERPNPQQPTQNLMATMASQRKSEVRGRRRVAKNGGAKTKTGFAHLPHPGLWKAQAVTSNTGAPSVPKTPNSPERVHAQVSFS